jgi:hypothetical protein
VWVNSIFSHWNLISGFPHFLIYRAQFSPSESQRLFWKLKKITALILCVCPLVFEIMYISGALIVTTWLEKLNIYTCIIYNNIYMAAVNFWRFFFGDKGKEVWCIINLLQRFFTGYMADYKQLITIYMLTSVYIGPCNLFNISKIDIIHVHVYSRLWFYLHNLCLSASV